MIYLFLFWMHKQEKITSSDHTFNLLDCKTCFTARIYIVINKKEDKMVFLLNDLSLQKMYTLHYY